MKEKHDCKKEGCTFDPDYGMEHKNKKPYSFSIMELGESKKTILVFGKCPDCGIRITEETSRWTNDVGITYCLDCAPKVWGRSK